MVIDRQFSIIDGATPKWVNETLFESLLRKKVTDFNKLIKFSTKYVNNCKENYLSVKADFETKDGKRRLMGFIMKTATLSHGEKLLPYLTSGSLAQENWMNFEIIPKFKALFETENKPKTFHPTSLKFPQSVPEDYVLFEDLQMKGYRPLQGGLSSPQMEAVLNNLAAFHAASVVEGNINQSVNQRMVKTPNKELQLLNNRIFHEHLRLYDLKDYEDKIKSLQSHFLEESSPSNSLEFQVLQVGNCCIDNMLFLLDAFGNVKDIAFINLDMCCYGNPVKDLLYLLLSSAINADKMNNFDYYIKYYHDQLVGYLKLLKFKRKIPKLWELQYDVIKNNKWAFEAVTQVLPLVLWDPSNSNESNLSEEEELPINDKFLKVMYAQENYCQQIQKLLPWMEDKAFLEE